MARQCAFCDKPARLTAEHVWPSCFLDRWGRTAAHFSVRAQQVHGADYVVNDVCAECNGERLSPLDEYFCQLYDTYFVHLHDFGATVSFRYDYDLLARSLLKIAYNSARLGGSNARSLRAFRHFILGVEPRPPQVAVFLEIVSPSMVPDPTLAEGSRKIMPQMYRSAITQLLVDGAQGVLSRVVAVNSFYFHIIVPAEPLDQATFDAIVARFGQLISGTVKLDPSANDAALHSSPQDGLRSIVPHVQANLEEYGDFFAKRRTD